MQGRQGVREWKGDRTCVVGFAQRRARSLLTERSRSLDLRMVIVMVKRRGDRKGTL